MIYWDHNATTPLRAEVADLLARAAAQAPVGNSSSVHQGGREARARVEAARAEVARVVGCEPREVCFTASGSEADALALKGAYEGRKDRARRRIVTSQLEHPAVLGTLKQLELAGATVVRVPCGPNGRLSAEAVAAELSADTALCSVMWANNETGVLQPVAEVARACRAVGAVFHSDAVQAAGKVAVTLRAVDADLLSFSAHKFGGPPGVGVLVARRGLDLVPLVPGHQEDGRRGGTHNVAYLEAFALALGLAAADLEAEAGRLGALRDRFEREVLTRIEGAHVNGEPAQRAPNTSNLRFEGADGEALLIGLDLEGICVSSGAACASGSLKPSHVLTAMGLTAAQAHGSLRFSLGSTSSEAEVSAVVEALCRLMPRVRA